MSALITNTRTKEVRYVNLNTNTLEQIADRLITNIACTYPKAYKLVHNSENHISIMAGNITKCIFELHAVEHIEESDDSFLF